jgi:hypothetical protein
MRGSLGQGLGGVGQVAVGVAWLAGRLPHSLAGRLGQIQGEEFKVHNSVFR